MNKKKAIYLVRHGIVKKFPSQDEFEDSGISFAENLDKILNLDKVDFIAYVDGKNRCKKTVEKLALINGIVSKPYNSGKYRNLIPYNDALKFDVSVICYGITEIENLLRKLKIEFKHKNELYEYIYKINFENNNTVEKITTGYSKRDN